MQEESRLAPDLTAPWVLPGGPSGVTLARKAVLHQLDKLGVADAEAQDTIELLVSELTSNVVKHAGGRATLRVTRRGDLVRIEVCDSHPEALPVERSLDLDAESGRGLLLVSTLATDWGYTRDEASKCTWVEIDLNALRG